MKQRSKLGPLVLPLRPFAPLRDTCLVCLIVSLAQACAPSPLDRLDLEAQRIITGRQLAAMGPEAQLDPDVEPDQPSVIERDRYYDRVPPTANAEVDELAVEPAGPRTPGAYPNVLDDIAQPDAVRLNLEELLAFAIGNSPDYRAEKEELYLAALSLIIERHLWGPRFFTAVTGRLTGSPESNDTPAAASVIGSLGVTQRLPYGGTVSATALADYVTFLREEADDGDETTASVGVRVSLDLPLLRGAGINSRAYNERIQAERDLIYAVREFERFRRAFLVDLATDYFDILRRQRQIANRQRQLRSLDRLTAQFKALAEAGRVPSFQAERAEQRVLFRYNSLLNQQENYVRNLDELKLQIGMDVTRPLEIIPVSIDLPRPAVDVDAAILTAFVQRLDLQNEEDFVDDARRRVLVARNQLLPDLSLQGDLDLPVDSTQVDPSFVLDEDESEYDVRLRLEVPLDRKIERAELRASLIRLERQRRQYATARDRVALSVRQAARSITQALYTLDLQERNVEIALRRAEQIRLNQRDLGSREVIEAEEDLLDARDLYDAAVSNLQANILRYLLDSGQMRVDAEGRWRAPLKLAAVERDAEVVAGPENAGFPTRLVPDTAPEPGEPGEPE